MRRILSGIIAMVITVGFLSSPALAAEGTGFSDVAEDDWFAPYVQVCVEGGLMKGVGEGRFDPNGVLSSAQCAVLSMRLYDLCHGGDGVLPEAPEDWGLAKFTLPDGTTREGWANDESVWYWAWFSRGDTGHLAFQLQTEEEQAWGLEMDYGRAVYSLNGQDYPGTLHLYNSNWLYFEADGGSAAGLSATHRRLYPQPGDWRRDAYCYADTHDLWDLLPRTSSRLDFARAIEAAAGELEPIRQVDGLPDVSDKAVLALYRAGVLSGSDDCGTFHPDQTLTRAQAAAILSRVLRPELRQGHAFQRPEGYAVFTLTYLCEDRPKRDYWPRPYHSTELLGLDDTTVVTADGTLISLPEGYTLSGPNPFLSDGAVLIGRYEEAWRGWRYYHWEPESGALAVLSQEAEEERWEHPHGNEAYNGGLSYGDSRPIYDAEGRALTPCFDWAGVLDEQGRGFVALAEKVYRIEFEK